MRSRPVIRRSPELAWLITVPLGLIAIVLLLPTVAVSGAIWSSWQLTLLFVGLFLAAESITMRVEVLRHGTTVSLTEIPVVLGLFYLTPLTLVSIRVLIVLLVYLRRRIQPAKTWFNVANVAAGTSLATTVMTLFHPARVASNPVTWLVLLAAVSVAVISTIVAVIGVITLVQGGTTMQRVVTIATPSLVVGE